MVTQGFGTQPLRHDGHIMNWDADAPGSLVAGCCGPGAAQSAG